MKLYKYFFVGLLTFFVNVGTCLAWGGNYNYEVTSFNVDQNNIATLRGWAIINARGGSQYLKGFDNVLLEDGDRQSGVIERTNSNQVYYDSNGNKFYGGYCNYGSMVYYSDKALTNIVSKKQDSDYNYLYELEVLDKNKNIIASSTSSDIVKRLNSNLNIVSLTYAQSIKCNTKDALVKESTAACKNDGDSYRTACYENVGFVFNIDMNKLKKLSTDENYAFRLKVSTGKKSTCGNGIIKGKSYYTNKCFEKFNLAFIELKTKNDFSQTVEYINTTDEVSILVRGGKTWNSPNITDKSKVSINSYPNSTYCVSDIRHDSMMNISWYKIKECKSGVNKGWVPASWVNPSGDLTYITPVKKEITSCISISPGDIKESAKTCGGTISAKNECLVPIDSNNYYDINCDETITSEFKPGILSLKAGQGFNYGVNLKSTSSCRATFDTSLWKEHYNNLLNNYNNPNISATEKKMYENNMNDLKKIVLEYNSYRNISAEQFFQDSSNSFNSLVAKMTIKYKTNGKDKKDVVDFIKDGSLSQISNKLIKDNLPEDLNVAGLSNPYNYTMNQEYSINLMLPKSYINTVTGSISYTDDNLYVDGGNNYYTNLFADPGTYNIDISISGMVYAKNISIINDKCALTITGGINSIYYRTIDLNNPFIDINRKVGSNWLNNDYSFVSIIDKRIWSQTPEYLFNLTKANIKSIKASNYLSGTNTYLGSGCSKNLYTNSIECLFLRNDDYFHTIDIKSER